MRFRLRKKKRKKAPESQFDRKKNRANCSKDKTVDFEGFSNESECHGQMEKQQNAPGNEGKEIGVFLKGFRDVLRGLEIDEGGVLK